MCNYQIYISIQHVIESKQQQIDDLYIFHIKFDYDNDILYNVLFSLNFL